MADPFSALWDDPDGSVSAARSQRAMQEALMAQYRPTTSTAALSDADVQRIAAAVADELERRAAHPLRVTAGDLRRWGIRG